MGGEKRVKAVLFDVGGVLQRGINGFSKGGIQETLAKKFHLSVDDYIEAIEKDYSKSIEGAISPKKLSKNLSKNLNVGEKKLKKIYSSVYKKRLKLNRSVLRIAKRLKKKGFKIGLLSDQWYFSKEEAIPENFYKIFNPVIVSCDVGCRKPSRKIYLLASKRLKLAPEEILFIDNRAWNLPPAKKLGMKTILFSNNKLLKKQLEELL